MSNIPVQKVNDGEKAALPIFVEMSNRLDEIRRRAHEFFQLRANGGAELDDWLKAEREVLGWAKAELTEKGGNYEVQVTLPGFDAKEVQVTATAGEIVVRAASEHTKKEEAEGNVVWSEFGSNEVYRRFELPKTIELDKIAAKLEKGILHITARCAAQAKKSSSEKQVKVVAA